MNNIINDIEFIIPCGGKGTRNYPHSKGIPHKSLLPFGDVRLIDQVLGDIIRLGGRHITIVCSNQEVIRQFQQALDTDNATAEKLRIGNRHQIADVLRTTFLPPDTELKFVLQSEPIGTAHVLGLAHRVSHNRHGLMIFPDDIILAADPEQTQIARLVRAFQDDSRQILVTGVAKEDVSNNGVVVNNRLIEKPKVAPNHNAVYSPILIPKAILDFIENQVDTYERTGKLPDNLPLKEWVYTDGINQFLDQADPQEGWHIHMIMKPDQDLLLDTGTLPLYEQAQLRALLKLSRFRQANKQFVRELLRDED